MKMFIAGNTGTMKREQALCNLGISRLLSYYYITTMKFDVDKAYRYALHLKGHPAYATLEDVGKPDNLNSTTEEFQV